MLYPRGIRSPCQNRWNFGWKLLTKHSFTNLLPFTRDRLAPDFLFQRKDGSPHNRQLFQEHIRHYTVVGKWYCPAFLHLMESIYFIHHHAAPIYHYRELMGYCEEKLGGETVQNQNRALDCDARGVEFNSPGNSYCFSWLNARPP